MRDDHVLAVRLTECQIVCSSPLIKQCDCLLEYSVVMGASDDVIEQDLVRK